MAKDFTMTGLCWMGLVILSGEDEEPVLGFDLWKYVAERQKIDPNVAESTAEYGRFKSSLAHLESNGWVQSFGKGRTRARRQWMCTDEGVAWWSETGLDLHGPERVAGVDVELPLKKWMRKDDLTPEMWRSISKGVQAGTLKIALQATTNKTKTSGGTE